MFWPLRGDAPARIGHLQDGLFAPEATPTACHIGAKGNALEPRPTTNTPALKGRNMVLPPIRSLSVTVVMASWCFVVSPFQGWSCSCGSCFQRVAFRCGVLSPCGAWPRHISDIRRTASPRLPPLGGDGLIRSWCHAMNSVFVNRCVRTCCHANGVEHRSEGQRPGNTPPNNHPSPERAKHGPCPPSDHRHQRSSWYRTILLFRPFRARGFYLHGVPGRCPSL